MTAIYEWVYPAALFAVFYIAYKAESRIDDAYTEIRDLLREIEMNTRQ